MLEHEGQLQDAQRTTGNLGGLPSDELDQKILMNLGDRVILKPLTRWNEAYKEFPRYVMEYLVSRYVQANDPVAGQAKIDRILTEHYAESAKKELIKSRIKEKGEYTLLGSLVSVWISHAIIIGRMCLHSEITQFALLRKSLRNSAMYF